MATPKFRYTRESLDALWRFNASPSAPAASRNAMTQIIPPVGGSTPSVPGVITRVDLIAQINVDRVKKGQPKIPLPQKGSGDFAEVEHPLRIEIETLLAKIAKDSAASKKERNKARRTEVELYLDANYPGNKRLKEKILADLISYSTWEQDDA